MEYCIIDKIEYSKKEMRDPSLFFESDILKSCPIEQKFLFPGKLYVFNYFPKFKNKETKPVFDAKPYIMSLGPNKDDNTHFYGINMHIIPYNIRLQIFEFIYKTFSFDIDKEIKKYPNVSDSVKQNYLKQMNTDLISEPVFNVDLRPCIHRYNLKYIKNCKIINYNLLHYMLQSESNYFQNGSIADVQKLFMKRMLKNRK